MSVTPLDDIARNYVAGVKSLMTPSMQVTSSERGAAASVSEADLVARAELLGAHSDAFTQVAAIALTDADVAARSDASTALLAKALADLEVASFLEQNADAVDAGAANANANERAGNASHSVDLDFALGILSGSSSASAIAERGTDAPPDVDTAVKQLTQTASDTLASVLERSARIANKAFTSIGALGLGALLKDVGGLIGDAAKQFAQNETVSRLYALARAFFQRAYDSLVALIGADVIKGIGKFMEKWFAGTGTDKKFSSVLEEAYETKLTSKEIAVTIAQRRGELAVLVTTIGLVAALGTAFDKQVQLADKMMSGLKYLNAAGLVSKLPHATMVFAAVYALIGSYIVLVGSDYVDSKHLHLLDRVVGVRRVVESKLPAI